LAPGQYVCLEVSDSGEGMDDETVGRIFDPFFTTKFTGRGLGLAAVQGILRGHHAGMEIETELGAGTTLRVFFPSLGEQPPTEEEAEPENLGLPQGSGLALVVDDEPMVLHVAKQVLEMSGFEVETCDRGATAVEIIEARSAEVQFILLDLTMPGMSGAEVFASVRERHPNLPIILMSGYAETAIAELDDSGPRGFVQKPFTVERLLDTVFTVLRSQQ
ncbi:MAG: response regulator, partial [Myxococcales bacterium]|nr:response regulator [Myxococcales bacterium]